MHGAWHCVQTFNFDLQKKLGINYKSMTFSFPTSHDIVLSMHASQSTHVPHMAVVRTKNFPTK